MSEKLILDACCGGRMFWFNKHHPNAVYVDKREMERQAIWTSKDGTDSRTYEVKPDIVADFTNLPFEENSFYHVVFDPPHLTRAGESSWIAKKYGFLGPNWRELLGGGISGMYKSSETRRNARLQMERNRHIRKRNHSGFRYDASLRTTRRQRRKDNLVDFHEDTRGGRRCLTKSPTS